MAPRTFLVDAFNLIHAVERLGRIQQEQGIAAASLALIDLVTRWLRAHPQPPGVVLVFDGVRPAQAPVAPPAPGLQLRWVDHDADAHLARLLERRGQHTLVSADAELVTIARREAQDVVKPPAFFADVVTELRVYGEQAEKTRSLSKAEVDYWLTQFGAKAAPPPAAPPSGGMDPDQVAYWLAYFGED